MFTLKEHFKGIVSDEKLESAIVFVQKPFVNEHRNRYLKLYTLEGKSDSFYNLNPLCEIVSNRIKDSFLLSSTHSGMFLEIENSPGSDPRKAKGSIGGLCEILCDWVVKNDYLQNSTAFNTIFTNQEKNLTVDGQKKLLDEMSSDASFFRRERWSREKSFHKRHGYYPNDYVSCEDHKRIMTQDETREINNEVLSKSLDKVKPGYYATLYFTRPNDSEHAMLVRRNNNIEKSFSFFDPNYIVLFDITKEEVSSTVTKILELYNVNNISYQDLGIIKRGKGISENLSTNNKSVAKLAEKEVRALLDDPNISMLTYKQLDRDDTFKEATAHNQI